MWCVFCQNTFCDLDAVHRQRDTFYKTLFEFLVPKNGYFYQNSK